MSTPEFARYIEGVQQTPAGVGREDIVWMAAEGATASVRLAGGMVMGTILADRRGDTDNVLTTNVSNLSDLVRRKLDAAYPMCPVGPNDGPGGQHGPLRWVDFSVEGRDIKRGADQDPVSDELVIAAVLPEDAPLQARRRMVLMGNSLTLGTIVTNSGNEIMTTSVGEHLWFPRRDDDPVTINGQTVDQLVGKRGAYAAALRGEAQLVVGGLTSAADIRFADGRVVRMQTAVGIGEAGVYHRRDQTPRSMLVWARPDSPTVCFEPVAGVEPSTEPNKAIGDNTVLVVPQGRQVSMKTKLSLITAGPAPAGTRQTDPQPRRY